MDDLLVLYSPGRCLDCCPLLPVELEIESRRLQLPVIVAVIKGGPDEVPGRGRRWQNVAVPGPFREDSESLQLFYQIVGRDLLVRARLDVVLVRLPVAFITIIAPIRSTVDSQERCLACHAQEDQLSKKNQTIKSTFLGHTLEIELHRAVPKILP